MAKKKEIKLEMDVPEGIEARQDGKELVIKGKKGEVKRAFNNPKVDIKVEGGKIIIAPSKQSKREKTITFTYKAHIGNMFKGAEEGHSYVLKVCSSHFPMNVAVNKDSLVVKNFLGEKYPRTLKIKEGVQVKVDGDLITIESTSKELAGTTASAVEELMKRADFDPRIFQDGIYIINKDGKELK